MSGLHPFDIFTIVVCGLMMLWGGFRGMFSQIMSIISLFISWIAASRYYPILSPYVPLEDPFKDAVALILFFGISLLITHLATKMIAKLFSFKILKEFDRQLGAFFGLIKGFLICLVVTFVMVLASGSLCQMVVDSPSGRFMIRTVSKIEQYIPNDNNHEKIHTALSKFSDTISNTDYDQEKADEEFSAAKEKITQWFQDQKTSNNSANGETSSHSGSGHLLDDFENLFQSSLNETAQKQISSLQNTVSNQLGSASSTAQQVVVAQIAEQNPNLSAALSTYQSTGTNSVTATAPSDAGGLVIMENTSSTSSTGSVLDHQNFTPNSMAPPF